MNNIIILSEIFPGMCWDIDGHVHTVISRDGDSCKVDERWISEDTLQEVSDVSNYRIGQSDGHEYIYSPRYAEFKLFALSAFNYNACSSRELSDVLEGCSTDDDPCAMFDHDREISSSSGDYSPSNPWDAPGMSIKDFI